MTMQMNGDNVEINVAGEPYEIAVKIIDPIIPGLIGAYVSMKDSRKDMASLTVGTIAAVASLGAHYVGPKQLAEILLRSSITFAGTPPEQMAKLAEAVSEKEKGVRVDSTRYKAGDQVDQAAADLVVNKDLDPAARAAVAKAVDEKLGGEEGAIDMLINGQPSRVIKGSPMVIGNEVAMTRMGDAVRNLLASMPAEGHTEVFEGAVLALMELFSARGDGTISDQDVVKSLTSLVDTATKVAADGLTSTARN